MARRSSRGGPKGSSPQKVRAPARRRRTEIPRQWRVVVGLHSVREVLRVRPQAVRQLWLRSDWQRSKDLSACAEMAQRQGWEVQEVPAKKLEDLSWGHQGVAVFVDEKPDFSWSLLDGEGPKTVVLLDGIEDPQNLGAMMRTGWLMGVDAYFVPKDRAVGLTPAVCKTASGGAEHLPLESVTNLGQTIKLLKKKDFWVYALAEGGADSLYQLALPKRVAWVVGAEDRGVRGAVLRECDAQVSIPQVKSGASYNASVALALALNEVFRSSWSSE